MNRKYRLFGKIPVVDILIVVVLVAFFGGAVWLLTRGEVEEQTGAESQADIYPFTAVLYVKNTAEENYQLVEVGDVLHHKDGTVIGTVTAVRKEPYVEYAVDQTTGEHKGTEMAGRVGLYISIKGEATADSAKGIFVGKKHLAMNCTIKAGTEKYYWNMRFVELTGEDAA